MKNAEINTLIQEFPLVRDLIDLQETCWFYPETTSFSEGLPYVGLTSEDVQDAHARLTRFAPYLAQAFPETAATNGIIESELVAIPAMQKRLETEFKQKIAGQLLLDGFYTLEDQTMYTLLGWLAEEENIRLEPSALAGMPGPLHVSADAAYHQMHNFTAEQRQNATHIVWATGGGMVPEAEMAQYLAKAK